MLPFKVHRGIVGEDLLALLLACPHSCLPNTRLMGCREEWRTIFFKTHQLYAQYFRLLDHDRHRYACLPCIHSDMNCQSSMLDPYRGGDWPDPDKRSRKATGP